MEEIVAVFIQEAREQLREMEQGLMALQGDAGVAQADPEQINAIFRAAHTIKGGAGVVEIQVIEGFTHAAENVLDKVRNRQLALDAELIDDLLTAADHLGALIDTIEQGGNGCEVGLTARGEAIAARLNARLGGLSAGQRETAATAAANVTHSAIVPSAARTAALADTWHVSLRFGRELLKNGMDPVAFLRYLGSLGEIVHLSTVFDGMPAAADMDPECCYLGFEIRFRGQTDRAAIEHVFDFVRDDCLLQILPPHSPLADYRALLDALPEDHERIGDILRDAGALSDEELAQVLRAPGPESASADSSAPAADDGLPATGPSGGMPGDRNKAVSTSPGKPKAVGDKKAAEARLIRVQADKLDQLIDLVGELVIAGASANLVARNSGQTALVEATSVLSRLVENIRDSALQLRMVQIGDTFNRFHRVVRDVSRELGKNIDLVINGGETELDKSVVEKIGDPLMHLVRNAIDHGIESAETRLAAGKPASGRIELNAFHDSGSIVIEVVDDGSGLPRERILQKAIERGLVQANDALSEQEVINLIFQPGFSTAEQVTNLSGRGVGMDVVRKNIQALRGRVDVQSESGRGSRFTIRLPLTLAIIDGFLVSAGSASYVIPLDMVVECLELNTVSTERDYLNLRGEVLPFIRLRSLFEVEGQAPRRENVVVVRSAHQKAGIVVDQLIGEFQTVIKPLGTLFRNLRGISGSTILGSGEVALILDVPTLTALAGRRESESLTTTALHR